MTPSGDRDDARLQDAMAKLFDGDLSDAEFEELSRRLEEDPAARELYFECASLETGLDMAFAPPLRRSGSGHSGQAAAIRRRAKRALGIAAAAAVVAASVLIVIQTRDVPDVVRLRLCGNSEWMVNGERNRDVATLPPGAELRLEQGVAELQLPHDVLAVVEAPARMILRDARTLQLDHGRAFFRISSEEGEGFTVVTPHQRIVDLGTAFGIDARIDRDEVELHVFEGRVRVDASDGGRDGEIVAANRAVVLAGPRVARDQGEARTAFLRELPPRVDTVFAEDFESGLAGGRDYAVQIDPTAIRDLAGNRFPGIDDDKTWNFATSASPAAVAISNPSFEERLRTPEGSPAPLAWTASSDQFRPRNGFGALTPTDGSWQAWMNKGTFGYQDTGEVIVEGATYTLRVDLGADQGHFPDIETVVIRLYGSDAGFGTPLAEITPKGPATTTWLADQTVSFTATPAQATGQTLGIYLGVTSGTQVEWDNVRLETAGYTDGDDLPDSFELAHTDPPSSTALRPGDDLDHDRLTNLQEFQHGTDPRNSDTDEDGVADGIELAAGTNPTAPPMSDALEGLPDSDRDTSPPHIAQLHPADGAADVMPTGRLTMTFNEPIKLGTGRIFLRNITDWTETEITVGDPRLSVDGPPSEGGSLLREDATAGQAGAAGRVLTITPPADLADGERQMGRIAGWECDAWAGIFNPGGNGTFYVDVGLNDGGPDRGTIGSMHGPVMATFGTGRPRGGIRRQIGEIAAGRRYTVSVAIGVRAEEAQEKAAFLGYTIRLRSGEAVLAEVSDDTPPGPPNSVTSVGLSWDASELPEGLNAGDPLILEIAPNQASGEAPGYLDLDNVRVTVVGE